MTPRDKIRFLLTADCFQITFHGEEEKILKGGDKTRLFIDLKKLYQSPMKFHYAVSQLSKLIPIDGVDVLCAVPYGAIPIVPELSNQTNLPFIIIKKNLSEDEIKRKKQFVDGGNWIHQKKEIRCAIIDDVVTNGTSCAETVSILQHHFENTIIRVTCILSLVSRKSLIPIFIPKEIPFRSWVNINQQSARIEWIMEKKSTGLVFAADLPSWQDLRNCIEEIGPYICILKLHSALYLGKGFDPIEIREWSCKYQFLVMEDAKIADIGSIVQRITSDIHEWADLITAVPVSGMTMIQQIHHSIGVFLLAEYSTKDQLLNDSYRKSVIQIAEANPHQVCGFICQNIVDQNGQFLHAMPGINQNQKGDQQGQTYETLEQKMKKGCDLFIVGRGIYNGKTKEDRITSARYFRHTCKL